MHRSPRARSVASLLAAAALVAATGSSGCKSSFGPSASTTLDGTWTGAGSIFRGTTSLSATLTMVLSKHSKLTQAGVPVTGSWTLTFADPSNNRSGSVSMTAYLVQDCPSSSGGGVTITTCHSNDPWVAQVKDATMSSSGSCNPDGSVSVYLSPPATISVAEVGARGFSCDFWTSLNHGQFNVVKQ